MKKTLKCPTPDAARHHAVLLTLETFLDITDMPAHQRHGCREKSPGRAHAVVSLRAGVAEATAARR